MRWIALIQDRLLAILAGLGAVAILALMVHVVADILMRNLMNRPIPATFEIVTHYYMITLAFVPLAWLERSGGMVRVEVLDGVMSPAMIRISDRAVSLLSAAIYGALTWVTFEAALRNTHSGTFVMTQSTRLITWPAFWLPPLGFALVTMVVAVRAVAPTQESHS